MINVATEAFGVNVENSSSNTGHRQRSIINNGRIPEFESSNSLSPQAPLDDRFGKKMRAIEGTPEGIAKGKPSYDDTSPGP